MKQYFLTKTLLIMKKIFFLITSLCLFITSFASFGIKPHEKTAAEIFLPAGKDKKISLLDLSTIPVKDYEILTGRHLKFFDRLAFKGAQKKLKNSFNSDGTINNKRLLRFTDNDGDHSTGFHVGGFLLGFFLGLIGIVIAYVAGGDDDVKRNRAKWEWIGFGVNVVIFLALLLSGVFHLG